MSETADEPKSITIPYKPRAWFRPLHASRKRWICTVAHRRAGKSVAQFNQLLRAALANTRAFPPPRYAYIGPSFAQTKDLIWSYCHQYAGPIPGTKFSESDLSITLPNQARIGLYGGAQAYERVRGLYLDGAVLDEFPLLHPDCFEVVVRPALADYMGFGILSGTPAGRDHFYEAYQKAKRTPNLWDVFTIPVTETSALHPDEVAEMKDSMPPNKFARELLCDFEAPIEGSYYGDILVTMQAEGRITKVPYDHNAATVSSWDLGMNDQTCIWVGQRVGKENRLIDYMEDRGKPLEFYVDWLRRTGYAFKAHILPHDVKAREMGTGTSRFAVLQQLGLEPTICPDHKVEDGISAVRSYLQSAWADETRCEKGLIALKMYQAAPAISLGTMHERALHNWASDPADSLRYMAVGLELALGWADSSKNWDAKFRNFRIPGL
jgi:phage terminase large subunit